mmetsp:Transcript_33610/g.84955  ORF Transcript_33610/g.84955 Transcript_33610/m.84955 type:complete len:630 (-) Transcript_33610:4541-6430(-)
MVEVDARGQVLREEHARLAPVEEKGNPRPLLARDILARRQDEAGLEPADDPDGVLGEEGVGRVGLHALARAQGLDGIGELRAVQPLRHPVLLLAPHKEDLPLPLLQPLLQRSGQVEHTPRLAHLPGQQGGSEVNQPRVHPPQEGHVFAPKAAVRGHQRPRRVGDEQGAQGVWAVAGVGEGLEHANDGRELIGVEGRARALHPHLGEKVGQVRGGGRLPHAELPQEGLLRTEASGELKHEGRVRPLEPEEDPRRLDELAACGDDGGRPKRLLVLGAHVAPPLPHKVKQPLEHRRHPLLERPPHERLRVDAEQVRNHHGRRGRAEHAQALPHDVVELEARLEDWHHGPHEHALGRDAGVAEAHEAVLTVGHLDGDKRHPRHLAAKLGRVHRGKVVDEVKREVRGDPDGLLLPCTVGVGESVGVEALHSARTLHKDICVDVALQAQDTKHRQPLVALELAGGEHGIIAEYSLEKLLAGVKQLIRPQQHPVSLHKLKASQLVQQRRPLVDARPVLPDLLHSLSLLGPVERRERGEGELFEQGRLVQLLDAEKLVEGGVLVLQQRIVADSGRHVGGADEKVVAHQRNKGTRPCFEDGERAKGGALLRCEASMSVLSRHESKECPALSGAERHAA